MPSTLAPLRTRRCRHCGGNIIIEEDGDLYCLLCDRPCDEQGNLIALRSPADEGIDLRKCGGRGHPKW